MGANQTCQYPCAYGIQLYFPIDLCMISVVNLLLLPFETMEQLPWDNQALSHYVVRAMATRVCKFGLASKHQIFL